jgi:hypoxanthine phosphoribosyltransferase
MRDVSWKECIEMCYKLAEIIKKDNYKPDALIGISRGGLIPLGILAYVLDVRDVYTISLKLYDENKIKNEVEQITPFHLEDLEKYKRVLVIDDVVDTGTTIEYVLSKFKFGEVKVASLFYKPKKSKLKPDYYVEETEEWINFPWSSLYFKDNFI